MASAWGVSWGKSWGSAWGATATVANNRGGFEMGRKVYIKRKKKIHIFDTIEDADAWELAEEQALKAIAKAKSRTAKRRIVRKVLATIPHETLRLELLDAQIQRMGLKVDMPRIEATQDWSELVRVAMLAREMEEEDELEALLMAL